jgi:hypothetical protein
MPSNLRQMAAFAACSLLLVRCGGLGGEPPKLAPVVKGPEGQRQHMVDKGPFKAYYDEWGRLQRIEQDTNGDGRPDRISRHQGGKAASSLEVDVDFDGQIDRWDRFGPDGKLHSYAVAGQDGRPHMWTVVDGNGAPTRYEYDVDVDGKTERAEVVENGRIARVELDTDRNGSVDRWQQWANGKLESESLDTDGDGRPDRRLRYKSDGHIAGIERLAQ